MLSQVKMVARKKFEKYYDCICDVIEYQEIQKENKSTGFIESIVISKQPCKISYEKLSTVNVISDNSAKASLSTKIFISPDIKIKNGSKVIVTNNLGQIKEYKSSGEPATYDTHQEIMLELFKGWS